MRLFDHLPYASLQRLKLSRALRVDDAALLCLAQIMEARGHGTIALRELDLGSPYITNASVPALSSNVRLAGLQLLTLWHSKISILGAASLMRESGMGLDTAMHSSEGTYLLTRIAPGHFMAPVPDAPTVD